MLTLSFGTHSQSLSGALVAGKTVKYMNMSVPREVTKCQSASLSKIDYYTHEFLFFSLFRNYHSTV